MSPPPPQARRPPGLRPARRLGLVGIAALVGIALGGCGVARPGRLAAVAGDRPPDRAVVRAAATTAELRASGGHFLDPAGRVVLLRGVNLSGDAKVPPFLPLTDPAALDRLAALGMNVVRLLFLWEAYEPEPGRYDEAYLARLVAIAEAAWARGLYVVVDIHQDGFARALSRGCGAGFPAWAISPRASRAEPDNGCDCRGWVFHEVTDPNVHRSFADFYADTHGVRTRYLAMLGRVAAAFAANPGVIGYDPLNEPWGDESRELAPLYRDAAAALRARHPTAILFLAGHAVSGGGLPSRLPRPAFDNVAYAPHYYNPLAILRHGWRGGTAAMDRAFATMQSKADAWDAPLFLGEFGMPADARRAGDFVSALYDRLDAHFVSGAQWNYTPRWTERTRDGWNGEDFNILAPSGAPRPNYRARPYPRKVAGTPVRFLYEPTAPPLGGPRLTFTWEHRPECGPTEVFVPDALFPSASSLSVEPSGATCHRDEPRQLLICRSPVAGMARVVLTSPGEPPGPE